MKKDNKKKLTVVVKTPLTEEEKIKKIEEVTKMLQIKFYS